MKALIIFDSYFGNTEKIARAIGSVFKSPHEYSIVKVTDFKPEHLNGVELLIVGSPTRGFRYSENTGVFLKNLPPHSLTGIKAAVFDTRTAMQEVKSAFVRFLARSFGYAAEPMMKALVQKGATVSARPEGYYVKASEGPLKDGEFDRAVDWARGLIQG